MSVGEVAGLIAACALLILVGLLAYPILKLGKVFDETRIMVKGVSDSSVPLLGEVTTTVATTNAQLAKVDTITDNAATVSTNAAALTSLFAATAGGPLVKAAAFTYGVRRAFGESQRRDVARRVKSEMKAERKAGKRSAAPRQNFDNPESVL
ncbi:DUF948 domain-containing protein [Kribbella sp. NBC_01245]|uniref:DUF948 domain-containing protein n=1 Tax=Kribbella sp. NBC_01245 TaxID=2903578 RepID=UPI002E2CB7E0|nr:DUF948 domain-containing protein [Kribbella sp. NBC_01245]